MEDFELLKSYRPRRLARWLGEADSGDLGGWPGLVTEAVWSP